MKKPPHRKIFLLVGLCLVIVTPAFVGVTMLKRRGADAVMPNTPAVVDSLPAPVDDEGYAPWISDDETEPETSVFPPEPQSHPIVPESPEPEIDCEDMRVFIAGLVRPWEPEPPVKHHETPLIPEVVPARRQKRPKPFLPPDTAPEPEPPPLPPPKPTEPLPSGELVIQSPWNGEYYSSVVRVSGQAPGFTNLAWRSQTMGTDGIISPMEDGTFSFSVATHGCSEDLDIIVSGINENSHHQEVHLRLINDGIGPSLDLVSPLPGDYFMDDIEIVGRVGSGPHDPKGIGEIQSLFWSLNGGEPRSVIFGSEGDFSFRAGTWNYSGRVELTLIAVDLNGNETRKVVSLIDGRLAPGLTLVHPADQSEYGSGVVLQGRVYDPYAGTGDIGGFQSIRYEILAADAATRDGLITGDVPIAFDGSFNVSILTADLSGDQEISVIVTGKNGKETTRTLRLHRGRSAIPDFVVQSGDAAAKAVWGAVPTATKYHIRVFDPGGGIVRHILSENSAVLAGLANGNEYSFQVEAFLPTGRVESHIVRTIPLSEETLRPDVTGEFRRIRVNWTDIPGSDTYAVYRAESEEGPYTLAAADVPGSEYLDTDINFGRRYWYAVAPAAYLESMSAPESAESILFQNSNIEQLARLDSISPESIHVEGAYAFVASRDFGLVLVDLSDPVRPVEVSQIEIPGAQDVAVRGAYAYVAAGISGLRVVNIDDPYNPIPVGSERAGNAVAVDVEGEYAFVADREKGLRVLDVSNDREPSRIAATDGLEGREVLVSGSVAYLAAGSDGVRIYDVSLPAAPSPLASIAMNDAESIILHDTLLIIGGRESGVHIYDVADPTEPKLLSRIADMEVTQLTSSREFLLATTPEELILVNIGRPENPFVFKTYPISKSSAMAVFEDNLLISANRGLELHQTYLVGTSFVTREIETEGRSYSVRNIDDRLYVSSHSGGLSVINPRTLVTEENYATEFAEASAGDADRIYVADGPAGVRVIGRGDGKEVVFEGNGFVHDVVVLGDAAYAASEKGLVVIGAADGVLRSLGTVDLPGARTVTTDGSLIFVGGEDRLRLLAPVAGALPVELFSVRVPNIRDAAAADGVAAAAGENGVSLFEYDERHPLNLIGEISVPNAESVSFDNRYLYLSAGHRGLLVYDIRRTESPNLVTAGQDFFALETVVMGDTAFVVDGNGLKRVSLFIPAWLR